MAPELETERTIRVRCTAPALKKLIPFKLAHKLQSITLIGEECEGGTQYCIRVKMLFAALIAHSPHRAQGLRRLRDQILKRRRKDHVTIGWQQCKELTPAFN